MDETEANRNAAAASSAGSPAGSVARAGTEGRASGRPPAATAAEDLRYGLVFDLLRNMRYHSMREEWFAVLGKVVQLISLVAGTAAGATLLGRFLDDPTRIAVSAVLGFLVGAVTLVNLVFDFSGKARLHAGLKQRFAAVLATVEAKVELSPAAVAACRAEMARIYGDEPSAKLVVDAVAWNETLRTTRALRLSDEDLIPISRWQRLVMHLNGFPDFDARTRRERAAA
jgi:hypothetical protein